MKAYFLTLLREEYYLIMFLEMFTKGWIDGEHLLLLQRTRDSVPSPDREAHNHL